MADCSWEEAEALCEEKGGHLAVISSVTELSKVVDLAEEAGRSSSGSACTAWTAGSSG